MFQGTCSVSVLARPHWVLGEIEDDCQQKRTVPSPSLFLLLLLFCFIACVLSFLVSVFGLSLCPYLVQWRVADLPLLKNKGREKEIMGRCWQCSSNVLAWQCEMKK